MGPPPPPPLYKTGIFPPDVWSCIFQFLDAPNTMSVMVASKRLWPCVIRNTSACDLSDLLYMAFLCDYVEIFAFLYAHCEWHWPKQRLGFNEFRRSYSEALVYAICNGQVAMVKMMILRDARSYNTVALRDHHRIIWALQMALRNNHEGVLNLFLGSELFHTVFLTQMTLKKAAQESYLYILEQKLASHKIPLLERQVAYMIVCEQENQDAIDIFLKHDQDYLTRERHAKRQRIQEEEEEPTTFYPDYHFYGVDEEEEEGELYIRYDTDPPTYRRL